jgi:hypothetical protein
VAGAKKEQQMDLPESVKLKLGEAVELWCEEILPGRPAILVHAVLSALKMELLKKQAEIERKFPR